VISELNSEFRLVLSPGGREWVLERFSEIDGYWRARTSCQTKPALEHCIQIYVGPVTPEARAILDQLPLNVWWPPVAAPAGKTKRPKKRRVG
jgi:hypothetical protein